MEPLTTEQVERFWSKVEKTDGCWIWKGWLKHNGYGMFDVGVVDGRKLKAQAHRVAYMLCVGPLVDGLTIDHVCRNRRCVRPDHLRQVTIRENILAGDAPTAINARKTHCPQGHELDGDNLYVCPEGKRNCKTCRREASRRYEQRKRLLAA